MIILSVDPALHGCGLALWREGVLIAAGYAPNKTKDKNIVYRCAASAKEAANWLESKSGLRRATEYGLFLEQLVLELPQVYARGAGKTKGDPNKNVLPLAMVDAALAALLSSSVEVFSFQPHAWKGSTSKPENASGAVEYVIVGRIKARLTADELRVIDWTKSVSHSWDVADAIGVGLHHLGRFERHRVLARE